MHLQTRSQKIDTCECVDACRISPRYIGKPLVNTPRICQRCAHQSRLPSLRGAPHSPRVKCLTRVKWSPSKCTTVRKKPKHLGVRVGSIILSPGDFPFSTLKLAEHVRGVCKRVDSHVLYSEVTNSMFEVVLLLSPPRHDFE